jgi:hypothetical protein
VRTTSYNRGVYPQHPAPEVGRHSGGTPLDADSGQRVLQRGTRPPATRRSVPFPVVNVVTDVGGVRDGCC